VKPGHHLKERTDGDRSKGATGGTRKMEERGGSEGHRGTIAGKCDDGAGRIRRVINPRRKQTGDRPAWKRNYKPELKPLQLPSFKTKKKFGE